MSRVTRNVVLGIALLVLSPRTAGADLTAFVGAAFSGKPQDGISGESHTSLSRGLAVGVGLVIVGFEFEWAKSNASGPGDGSCTLTRQDLGADCGPSLTTGMGNVLLQTPRLLGPVQVYGTAGAGVYRERLDVLDSTTTNVGTNVGGGVKISLLGPLRVRIDYRVFKLAGNAVHATPQRLYVGANVAF